MTQSAPTQTESNQAMVTQPEPEPEPIAPVDAEPVPSQALGATNMLRVSDIQRITYEDHPAASGNSNAPTVLLLHDFGGSSVHWRGLIPMLTPQFRVIAMDLRNHGNSTHTQCCATLAQLQTDVLILLDALDVQTVHVVGSGGGAVLAQKLAVSEPERTRQLVFIGGDTSTAGNSRYRELLTQWQGLSDDAIPDPALLANYNSPAPDLTATAARRLDELINVQRSTPASVWAGALALFDGNNLAPFLTAVVRPTLLLHGDGDQLIGEAGAIRLAQVLRTDVRQTIVDAGRYPAIEQPSAVATYIRRFLSPRGSLHSVAAVSEVTRGEVDNLGSGLFEELLVREITGEPACSIRWYRIEYQTEGAAGESTNASAAVGVPGGDSRFCTGERPLLLYAHGTSTDRNYNAIDSSEVGVVITSTIAAHGNIIVAPDYTGYGKSWLDYHPYLNARANAADMIDALRAAKTFLAGLDEISAGPLFISGYSQGGYVAMATHREIELFHNNEFSVRGSFPMSGPYALDNTVQRVLNGRPSDGASQLLPFFTEGYERAYGNVFSDPADIFNPPFDKTAIGVFPGEISSAASLANGLLPPFVTATQGDPYLLRQDFVADYLSNPQNTLRQAVERNSLIHNWAPSAPMQLCGSNKDTVVFFNNTLDAVNAFAARGVNVRYWDFNRAATFNNGVFDRRYLTFRTLILFASDSEYHVAVAPFCAALARAFISHYRLQ